MNKITMQPLAKIDQDWVMGNYTSKINFNFDKFIKELTTKKKMD